MIELAARGLGSLAGSIVTIDSSFARDVVLGLHPGTAGCSCSTETTRPSRPATVRRCRCSCTAAPAGQAAGRRWAASAACCITCSHGRSGQPACAVDVTGRWTAGAERNANGGHPFRKPLAELRIGDTVVAGPRRVTLEDIEHFAEFTGDTFYAHMDDEAARANPFFDGRVAHGYLIVSFAAGLFVQPDPGPVLANYGLENLRFLTPVYPGDELTVTLTCKQITPREDAEHGEVRWDVDVTNQDGQPVPPTTCSPWWRRSGRRVPLSGIGGWESRSRAGAGPEGQAERDGVAVAQGFALAGGTGMAAADGHAVGQRTGDTPSSSSSPAGPPTTRTCRIVPEGPHGPPEILGQHGELGPQPDGPPLTRPWWRSNGSRPPGPSTTSIPAAEAGALTSRKPWLPSLASNRCPPSTRRQGPRLTQSAAARGCRASRPPRR